MSPDALTPRQMRVLELLADGLDSGEIGQQLWITRDTVKAHRKWILLKLGARNAAHAVAIAYRTGVLDDRGCGDGFHRFPSGSGFCDCGHLQRPSVSSRVSEGNLAIGEAAA